MSLAATIPKMDLKGGLKEQYHAALKMLRQAVEVCPNELWLAGEFPRNTWRIAYHAVFYAHLYMAQTEADHKPWPKRRDCSDLWADANPPQLEPYSKGDILEYIDFVDSLVDETIDGLDLESSYSGFHWYPRSSKISHEILSIRHLQGHVGQISELLMARGIDVDWVSMA